MATTARYLASIKNVPAIFQKIRDGVPPDKFNYDHLKAIGFTSSNDRGIVPLLKDLGFLTGDGTPTQRYRDYRNHARSRGVMAAALREAYSDIFRINEKITKNDREAVNGLLKSLHDSSDAVADVQTRTFFALLELADLQVPEGTAEIKEVVDEAFDSSSQKQNGLSGPKTVNMPLTYRFEIQLPASKDVDVFRAIFRAMREELFDE